MQTTETSKPPSGRIRSTQRRLRLIERLQQPEDLSSAAPFAGKWSARCTTLFVIACSCALWALIIWAAIQIF